MTIVKRLIFAVPVFLLFSGCAVTEKKINLLTEPGLEKQTALFYGDRFQPFSKMISPCKSGWLVKNPEKVPVIFSVFKGQPLDPTGIYELKMRYVGQEGIRLIVCGSEYGKEKIQKNNILLNTVSSLNVNGAAEYRKEFAVSPACELLFPSLSVINPGKLGHAVELLVEDLSIRRVGNMKFAPEEIKKINLASDYDFSKYPAGDFPDIHKGNGVNAKKWSNIKAEIVELNGEKVLHIIRKPENYIYPYMALKPFPIDPKYHFIKLSFKIKGKGSIKPGLWWKRSSLGWDYYHGLEVKLSDEWQTVTVIHPCMTPDVKSATMSFSSNGHGEFWIKDIFVNME